MNLLATDVDPSTEEYLDHTEMCTSLRRLLMLSRKENQAISERYERLVAMINHVPDFIYAKDLEGRFLFANRAIVENNGYEVLDEMIGLTDADIHPSEAADRIALVERRVMETGEPDLGIEERRLRGEGWLMMSRVPLVDRSGRVIGIVGASRDISARKKAEIMTQIQTTLLNEVARGVNLKKFIKRVAVMLEELLPGRKTTLILGDKRRRPHSEQMRELPIISRDNECHGVLLVSSAPNDDANLVELLAGICRIVGIAIDRHHDAKRIAFLAEHDALTGLMNRAALDRKLAKILKGAALNHKGVAVAFVDLDNFKLVNDSLGHAAGDQLLKVVAQRILQKVGGRGLVSRIGGDEFIVVLTQSDVPATQRLSDIRAAISEPVILSGMALHVTCSIGVACYARHGQSPAELFTNADLALYRVKERGRDGIMLFSPTLADEARKKLELTEQLRTAVERDEFVVHYQPQKHLGSGRVSGVEALVRWNHPNRGLVYPGDFIVLAEETGLITAIGESVLRKACAQAKLWTDAGIGPVTMAVNMSARQFRDGAVVSKVAGIIHETGIDPSQIEIEVTESLIMQDVEGAIAKMHGLTKLGLSLSIDDFGTGYSSLSILKKFPLSRLKIDRSFIRDLPHNAEDKAIVSAIVNLAKSLDLEIVAEGVETKEQAAFLAEVGCHEFQGFLFAQPSSAEVIETLLLSHGVVDARNASRITRRPEDADDGRLVSLL
jgi:diguanylate cyclase (GGDEF)-like protein/PAS domain S-box-containing protein